MGSGDGPLLVSAAVEQEAADLSTGVVADVTSVAGRRAGAHERFLSETAALVGRVRFLAKRARVEDVEEVVAEWECRAWRAFVRLTEENEAAEARGEAAPHRIAGYLTGVARNLLVDLHRARRSERRNLGRREVTPRLEERQRGRLELEGEEERGDALGLDGYVDERAMDPEEVALRRERREALLGGIGALPAEEREAVVGWLRGETDEARGSAEGVSLTTAWRRRQRGLARLREALRAAGWELRRERRGKGGMVRVRSKTSKGLERWG